jgi:hypothetical protein
MIEYGRSLPSRLRLDPRQSPAFSGATSAFLHSQICSSPRRWLDLSRVCIPTSPFFFSDHQITTG